MLFYVLYDINIVKGLGKFEVEQSLPSAHMYKDSTWQYRFIEKGKGDRKGKNKHLLFL